MEKEKYLDYIAFEVAKVSGYSIKIPEKIPILSGLIDDNIEYIKKNCNNNNTSAIAARESLSNEIVKQTSKLFDPYYDDNDDDYNSNLQAELDSLNGTESTNILEYYKLLLKLLVRQLKKLLLFNRNAAEKEQLYLESFEAITNNNNEEDFHERIENLRLLIGNRQTFLENLVQNYYDQFLHEFDNHMSSCSGFASAYIDNIERQSNNQENDLKVAKIKLESTNKNLNEIIREMQQYTNENAELKNQNSNLKELNENQLQKIKSLTEKINKLTSDLSNIQNSNQNPSQQLQIQNLTDKDVEIENLIQKLKVVIDKNAELEAYKNKATAFMAQSEEYMNRSQTVNNELKNELKQCKSENGLIKIKYDKLFDDYSEMKNNWDYNIARLNQTNSNLNLNAQENNNLRLLENQLRKQLLESETEKKDLYQRLIETQDQLNSNKYQEMATTNDNRHDDVVKLKDEEINNLNNQISENKKLLNSQKKVLKQVLENREDIVINNSIDREYQEQTTQTIQEIMLELDALRRKHDQPPITNNDDVPKIMPYTPFHLKTFLYNSVSHTTFDIGLFNKSLCIYGKRNIQQALRNRRFEGLAKKNTVQLYSDLSIEKLNEYRTKYMKILEN